MTKFLAQSKQVSPFLITYIFFIISDFLTHRKNTVLCTEFYFMLFINRGIHYRVSKERSSTCTYTAFP